MSTFEDTIDNLTFNKVLTKEERVFLLYAHTKAVQEAKVDRAMRERGMEL